MMGRYCFFFNDTATTEIYTLSLHDALPISGPQPARPGPRRRPGDDRSHRGPRPVPDRGALQVLPRAGTAGVGEDRKSTRLNSSHANISYAVFCLKKIKLLLHRSIPPYHSTL